MMMMMKGGLWKHSEDEVLKAAIMKYGLNRWPTISSLVHKPADQCKARWFEWLHPSIKKIAWTRGKNEVMPSQWRTIAPVVGRSTPSQCMERYQKLLDAACSVDEECARKLYPHPNPECKPARPDPEDMDTDEKEMLSEVCARLANTRGKKAKRKAKEKQIQEARRLASLQKLREQKAAGINGDGKKKRKRSGIDYNAEIPFEKRPPPGFYDVSDDSRPKLVKFPMAAIENGGEGIPDREKRRRKSPTDIAVAQRWPQAIVPKMSKLNLPAPQIPEAIIKTPRRRQVLCGLKNLPHSKNDYQFVVEEEKFEFEENELTEEEEERTKEN